jgi:hypothetical protein
MNSTDRRANPEQIDLRVILVYKLVRNLQEGFIQGDNYDRMLRERPEEHLPTFTGVLSPQTHQEFIRDRKEIDMVVYHLLRHIRKRHTKRKKREFKMFSGFENETKEREDSNAKQKFDKLYHQEERRI